MASKTSAFLSSPAANPTGFLNFKPNISLDSSFFSDQKKTLDKGLLKGIYFNAFKKPKVILCAASGRKRKRIGRIKNL